ncbi:multidrug effflux MFS transporter [Nitratireductor aestuarii]|nr:multidrug effflux MFS transporter [Nitratireductor aestuarii]
MSERKVSLIGAMLVAIGPVSMALYTPAMTEIVHAFGTTEAAVKMTLSTYFAGFAIAQLFCGPLSDAFGRRPVVIGFMGIYAIASLIALFSPTIEILILSRFLQGIGAAAGVAVSRAIVRDLFTREQSARIMNLIGVILSIGPAVSPTIGGLMMELAGWHSIFFLMLGFGFLITMVAKFAMVETAPNRDPSRASPKGLYKAYSTLFRMPYFIGTAFIMAGTSGALYTQATVMPFVLMDRVGLSPTQFGLGMLVQSGTFFVGTLTVHFLMKRVKSGQLVPVGLSFIAIGSISLLLILNTMEPSFLRVMLPSATFAFGIAFVMPFMMTASMAPFPHMAGSASALTGFTQMSAGLLGGVICALIGDPVVAMSFVVPGMGAMAVTSWLLWRRLPEPAQRVS